MSQDKLNGAATTFFVTGTVVVVRVVRVVRVV